MLYVNFKICIFGNGGVGKTTLVNRFLTGLFKSNYKITIGADFYMKKVIINDKTIMLQIWDFCGESRFRFLLPRYAEGSSGGIFMYDITRYSSIKNLQEWLEVFKEGFVRHEIQIPLIMVGGKLDLESKRSISFEDVRELAKINNFSDCIECSSKNDINVEEIFKRITRLMMGKAGMI